uniref:Uncharacterized protein n=1 Tax=Biomphalaria glabrata TaxID=6526 RepID=A0A2C9KTF1_BIOGL
MVHGAWSEWQPWACQERCQFMKRTRKCDNPAPKNNGRNCTGITEQFGMNTGCTKGCTTVSQTSTTTTKETKGTYLHLLTNKSLFYYRSNHKNHQSEPSFYNTTNQDNYARPSANYYF